MKPKKPARIKGSVRPAFYNPCQGTVPACLILPINNPDALVTQMAIEIGAVLCDGGHSSIGYEDAARAALRSIGVPLKGRK